MSKILLEIRGMQYSQAQTGAYVLFMQEVDGNRRLPIIIGAFEAHAIAIEMEKIKPVRPLTHDLFKSFATAFGIRLKEVVINKFKAGVFHAVLVCYDGTREVEIDSRTSDGIAIALRFSAPVFVLNHILDEAGIPASIESDEPSPDETESSEEEPHISEYHHLSIEKLEELLQKAIETENYEQAGKIRDELQRRKKQ